MFPSLSPAYTELTDRRDALRRDDVDGAMALIADADGALKSGKLTRHEHYSLSFEFGETLDEAVKASRQNERVSVKP